MTGKFLSTSNPMMKTTLCSPPRRPSGNLWMSGVSTVPFGTCSYSKAMKIYKAKNINIKSVTKSDTYYYQTGENLIFDADDTKLLERMFEKNLSSRKLNGKVCHSN